MLGADAVTRAGVGMAAAADDDAPAGGGCCVTDLMATAGGDSRPPGGRGDTCREQDSYFRLGK